MKYIAIIRHKMLIGDVSKAMGFRTYKSDEFYSKDEAVRWLKENEPKIINEYSKYKCEKSVTKTILALDEKESENYKEFIEDTFY